MPLPAIAIGAGAALSSVLPRLTPTVVRQMLLSLMQNTSGRAAVNHLGSAKEILMALAKGRQIVGADDAAKAQAVETLRQLFLSARPAGRIGEAAGKAASFPIQHPILSILAGTGIGLMSGGERGPEPTADTAGPDPVSVAQMLAQAGSSGVKQKDAAQAQMLMALLELQQKAREHEASVTPALIPDDQIAYLP